MIASAGGLAGLARFGGLRSARAQALSGKITVGYEGGNQLIADVVKQAIDAITSANPGVEIEVQEGAAGNYATQLFLSLSSGDAPDVFLTTGLAMGDFATPGLIEPLDAYLESWDGWQQYPDNVRAGIMIGDKSWALPYAIDTHFIYYRKDLFDQAGSTPDWQPSTPDEILSTARALLGLGSDVIPYGLYAGANGGNSTVVRGFLPLLYAYGGALTDESGKWIIESCPIQQALAYYETAYQVDKTVPQEAMTSSNPTGTLRSALAAGELGILYDGCWVYGGWLRDDPDVTNEQIGFTLHPTADGRPPFAVGAVGNTWYMNAKSASKPLAWEVIKTINSREAHVQLNTMDPHIPARSDAAADPAFQATPFLAAMVDSMSSLVIAPPNPAFRQLIGVIQSATGIVATGESTPAEAMTRYGEEMTRILGEENVVKQPCP